MAVDTQTKSLIKKAAFGDRNAQSELARLKHQRVAGRKAEPVAPELANQFRDNADMRLTRRANESDSLSERILGLAAKDEVAELIQESGIMAIPADDIERISVLWNKYEGAGASNFEVSEARAAFKKFIEHKKDKEVYYAAIQVCTKGREDAETILTHGSEGNKITNQPVAEGRVHLGNVVVTSEELKESWQKQESENGYQSIEDYENQEFETLQEKLIEKIGSFPRKEISKWTRGLKGESVWEGERLQITAEDSIEIQRGRLKNAYKKVEGFDLFEKAAKSYVKLEKSLSPGDKLRLMVGNKIVLRTIV